MSPTLLRPSLLTSLLVLLVCVLPNLLGAAPVPHDANPLMRAYGFVRGQAYTYMVLKRSRPDLAGKISYYTQLFMESALGKGWTEIDRLLRETDSRAYESINRKLTTSYSEILNRNIHVDERSAQVLLKTLHLRSNGKDIPEDIIQTLLQHNPAYEERPVEEFNDYWIREFNTDTTNNKKYKNLHLAIRYPASWKKNEGAHPRVVQVFHRKYKDTSVGFSILSITPTSTSRFSTEEFKEFINDPKKFQEFYQNSLANSSYELIKSESITIENTPFAFCVIDTLPSQTSTASPQSDSLRTYIYCTIHRHRFLVCLFFHQNNEHVEELQKKYEPLFSAIMNSLTWTATP